MCCPIAFQVACGPICVRDGHRAGVHSNDRSLEGIDRLGPWRPGTGSEREDQSEPRSLIMDVLL